MKHKRPTITLVRQNTGKIVVSAIKKLMRNTGWTARTIIKFIKMEYKFDDPRINRKVSRALKRGVRVGLLQHESGRYRLNDLSTLANSVSSIDVTPKHSNSASSAGPTRRRGSSTFSMDSKSHSPSECSECSRAKDQEKVTPILKDRRRSPSSETTCSHSSCKRRR